MKSLTFVVVCIIVCLAGAGCGGGSNPFIAQKGNYAGTWQSGILADSGQMTLSVQGSGQATGTMTDTGTGAINGIVTATLLSDGTFSGTVQYGSNTPIIMSGNLNVNSGGHLAGTVTEFMTGNGYAVTVDLAPQ